MNNKKGSLLNRVLGGLIIVLVLLYFVGLLVMGEDFLGIAVLYEIWFPILALVYMISLIFNFRRFDKTDKIIATSVLIIFIYIAYEVGAFCKIKVCPWPTDEREILMQMYKENPWLDPSSPQYMKAPSPR